MMKQQNLPMRKELFKFIFSISKFFTIRMWNQVIDSEVKNAILTSIGEKPIDLTNYVFDYGLGHCYGSTATIKSKDSNIPIPQEAKDKLFSALKDPEQMSEALCQIEISEIEEMNERKKGSWHA